MEPHIEKRPAAFGSWFGFVLAAAAAVAALWFLERIVVAVLLLFFALVVSIALSAPVNWFVRRGLSRRLAGILTLLIFFGTIILLAALVIPTLVGQMVVLGNRLPLLIGQIDEQIASLLTRYPDLQPYVSPQTTSIRNAVPSGSQIFEGLGGISLSLLGAAALAVVFFSTVAYVVLDPRPLLNAYLGKQSQEILAEKTSYTPINNDAQPKVDASVSAFLTNTPERQKQGYKQNFKFWVPNFAVAQEKWAALMAGN